MALTLLTYPAQLNPVYSPIWYRVSSTLSSEANFRYVFDTYVYNLTAHTSTKVHRSKLFPRSDGTGQYSPARILENYVSYDFDFFGAYFKPAMNSVTGFNVKVGEEYELTASTYSFTSTTSNAGLVQYNFPTPVTFYVGDEIKIDKADKQYNSTYDGLQTVTQVVSSTAIRTNKPYGDVVSNESGDCTYRLTIISGVSYSGIAINFAAQFTDRHDGIDYHTKYSITTPSIQRGEAEPLTNIDYNIRLQSDESYFISWYANHATVRANNAAILTYSNNIAVGAYLIPNSFGTNADIKRFSFACGPRNLSGLSAFNYLAGATQLILTGVSGYWDVTKYEIYLQSSTLVDQVSNKRTIEIVKECSEYPKIRLAFLNRVGGVDIFSFTLKSERSLKIDREYYTKNLAYNYAIQDRGEAILNINHQEEISAWSNYLTEDEVEIMKELFTSPEVYEINDAQQRIIPVVITSNEYVQKTKYNDEMELMYQIKYRYAFKQKQQRN
ncbi:MAG: hypothetical protein U0Y08_14960 [Bacteroidia bacterium]